MIYQYTLAPIESILETVFVILIGISNSYFLSLVLLAILVRLATKPLEKYANRAVSSQTEIESVLAPQINAIKQELTAAQRHEAIKRLYARYSYHPVFAIRSLAGLGVQLPFFIAAYFMLTGFSQLDGIVIPILGNLGQPDTLLFGDVHLMPFVMTLVNVLALLTVPGFSRKNLAQGLFISLMFLVLLYASPLGLLIYWTTSNLFSLTSNFAPAISAKLKLGKSRVQFRDTFAGRSFEEYAYIFFVTNLAILVPLLGVLGDQFNFFTAHSLPGSSIVALLLVISLAPALVLSMLRWLIKRVGFANVFDGAVLFVFLGLFLTYSLNKIGYGLFPLKYEPIILFFLALLLTGGAVAFIIRTQLLRTLSYFSLIIPLIFLDFIFVSPASTLFRQSGGTTSSEITGVNDTPIFLLVFDEFSGTTLQNSKGELDVSRYPGFAELAAQADYFPNALTADYHTDISVPSIVSGNLRTGGKRGLAPGKNLIEMFHARESVHAFSSVLPADLMYMQDTNQYSLISDFLTLYLHILSHQDWIEDKIGAIPQTWKGFGIFFKNGKGRGTKPNRQGMNPQVGHFVDWLDGVKDSEENSQFNFLHIEYPHGPYTTTSMGRPGLNSTAILPMLKDKENLIAEQSLLNVAYHNYMQQSAYADRLVQDFVQVLKKKKLFDRSLIIVTADHGVSYNKEGINRRDPANQDSWKNIVSIPLLVKYPHQTQGSTITSFVTNLDISATVMDVIGIDSPWESVGRNLQNMEDKAQTPSVELIYGYRQYFQNTRALFEESRSRKDSLFGEESPVHSIAVNYTENPIYTALLQTSISEAITGEASELYVIWSGSLEPEELSYFGTVYLGNRPANNRVITAVIDKEIQAVFESGQSLNQDGFFAFSLPENETVPLAFNVVLYEIEPGTPLRFRKVDTTHQKILLGKEFQSKQLYPYDWKNSVRGSNGLDDLKVGRNGMSVLSSESNDPFVVFEPISETAIAEPIFRIELESNRALSLNLYYQTVHKPVFDGSQRQTYMVSKGSNSFYIKIPEEDVSGPFRIDTGFGGVTEVIIRNIELRH
jgi:hypothetical protein